jgi:TctA family transporter
MIAARWLGLVAFLRGGLVAPFVIVFAALGSWFSGHAWENLVLFAGLGLLGCAFKRHGWPIPPFAIGLLLGGITEVSLHRTLDIWGPAGFLRPSCLVLGGLIAASLIYGLRRRGAAEPAGARAA